MINKLKLEYFFFLLLLLFSCAARQDIMLNLDGSGTVAINVVLEPVFVNYLYDIAEATSGIKSRKDLVIFDVKMLKTALEKHPGIMVEQILSRSQESLELKLKCKDLAAIAVEIDPDSKQSLLTFTAANGIKEFRFFLAKANYQDIKQLFPLLKEALFENLEPQVDEEVSKEEYLDIVEFAMDKTGRKAVLDSFIDINVKIQGKVISQQGGILKDGIIKIRLPLIDVLLLNQPVQFSVKFQ